MSKAAHEVGRGIVLRETERAILVRLDEDDREIWIPKSVLHDDSELYQQDDQGMLVVHEWFAEKEGL